MGWALGTVLDGVTPQKKRTFPSRMARKKEWAYRKVQAKPPIKVFFLSSPPLPTLGHFLHQSLSLSARQTPLFRWGNAIFTGGGIWGYSAITCHTWQISAVGYSDALQRDRGGRAVRPIRIVWGEGHMKSAKTTPRWEDPLSVQKSHKEGNLKRLCVSWNQISVICGPKMRSLLETRYLVKLVWYCFDGEALRRISR